MALRPYQQRVFGEIQALWRNGVPRVIAVLPTGGGKTVLASELVKGFNNPLSICHTNLLKEQLEESLGAATAATWQGLRKRGEFPSGTPDIVVVDEVHVGDSPDWQNVFDMIPESVPVLGLTATPWRFTHGTDPERRKKNKRYGKGLGDLFGAIVVGVTPRELVHDGWLVPIRVVNVLEAQNAERARRGEKQLGKKGRIIAGSDVRLDPVDSWLKHGEGRKTMVFCHMIASAERTFERFQLVGVKAGIVHGKRSKEENRATLAAFKRNELTVVVNVMQMTAGIDVPDVSCIVLDRGANTLNTYVQICGRGARPAPGKTDCLLLDLSGCTELHGHPQKDQDYWVTTCEGRALSELACEVCGTRLSPMFPTRCMKCDPFHPSPGDPVSLLDTGMRVYHTLKTAREALVAEKPEASQDEQDHAILAGLQGFEPSTDTERDVLEHERRAASDRITHRELARKAEVARVEAEERAAKEREERAAKLAADTKAWRERVEASRTAAREASKPLASALGQDEPPVPASEAELIRKSLAKHLDQTMARGWGLGGAVRYVRDSLPRWKGKYERENYTVPPELFWFCQRLPGKYREYELEFMLKNPGTSKFGEAWCRQKVRQLFG